MIADGEGLRSVDALRAEIRARLGVYPEFFRAAERTPGTLAALWAHARVAYVEGRLPFAFSERLFVYLSRFCAVPYCAMRHVTFLLRAGATGDAAPGASADEVLTILDSPLPSGAALDAEIARVAAAPELLDAGGVPDRALELAVFHVVAAVFLPHGNHERAEHALRQALSAEDFDALMLLLGFVRAAHLWTQGHPEIRVEPDVHETLREHPSIRRWFERRFRAARQELGEARDAERAWRLRVYEEALLRSPSATVYCDLEGRITEVNPAFLALFGFERSDEVVGRLNEELDAEPVAVRGLMRVLRDEGSWVGEVHPKRTDGTVLTAQLSATLVCDSAGEPLCTMASLVDLTERRRAERSLARRSRQQAALAELGKRALVAADLDGLLDGAVHLVAEAVAVDLCKVLEVDGAGGDLLLRAGVGWNPGAVGSVRLPAGSGSQAGYTLARTEPVVAPDLDRESRFEVPELLREQGARSGVSTVIPGVEAPWGVLSVYARRVRDYAPEDVGFLQSVAHLLGDAVRLRATGAALEERGAALERFVYAVSHDLRSPLITIQGFLPRLQALAAEADPVRAEDAGRRIGRSAERMKLLLDELLQLSRVGRIEEERAWIPLDEVAREAAELVAGRAAERGAVIDVPPHLPRVWGVHRRLVEVLQNLLDNAVKFLGDQPRPEIRVEVRRDGDEVVVCVADNGQGIEAKYRERIFGLFDKLDPATEGTGMGLALVRRIVESHGGRIWVESEGPGRGSRFCFTLKRADA